MNLTMTHLVCFTLGFVAGVIPDIIKHYSYYKHLEALGSEDPLSNEERYGEEYDEVVEDIDDVKEREKQEEEEIGFW